MSCGAPTPCSTNWQTVRERVFHSLHETRLRHILENADNRLGRVETFSRFVSELPPCHLIIKLITVSKTPGPRGSIVLVFQEKRRVIFTRCKPTDNASLRGGIL